MVSAIQEHAKEEPVVITGDFNAALGELLGRLSGRGGLEAQGLRSLSGGLKGFGDFGEMKF